LELAGRAVLADHHNQFYPVPELVILAGGTGDRNDVGGEKPQAVRSRRRCRSTNDTASTVAGASPVFLGASTAS
jgi:hypothetical protein